MKEDRDHANAYPACAQTGLPSARGSGPLRHRPVSLAFTGRDLPESPENHTIIISVPALQPRMPIRLGVAETPFDIEEFSQQLGETSIKVVVPRDSLEEVLKRAFDFINFGIYVYSVVVIPSPTPTMETFIVQMDRIDYNEKAHVWMPFQDRRADTSPDPGGDASGSSS